MAIIEMRKRISKHMRWVRYIFLAGGIALIFLIAKKIINETMTDTLMLILFVALLFTSLFFYLFNQLKTVEFDTKYMYVKWKSTEEKTELKNIITISLTLTELNGNNMWQVDYYDEMNRLKSVKFYPKWLNSNFQDFKDLVKMANSNVRIKNSANTSEF